MFANLLITIASSRTVIALFQRLQLPLSLGVPAHQVQDRIDRVRHDRYRLLHDFYPDADDEEN
ncbi:MULTISPECIES: hypothetical protein [unclassified Pseudomonas]|uniref:hypothetical protein n=1 Tax=unclassified Pseudomonas TaxID=196821 RepID=UPI002AC98B0C|nr:MULTISPECIES: hypothetical protein [unclassified Pseudomonas]MEB0047155.1 hypothetical protein [Pseudomonas sp. Dout3]MEB0096793.1 hypothetical protein [Pseudomonas sp. DC1.2]WPX61697.1 hypothetical protein RHM68_16955 [Pseudomonas sp. DC1.2]